MPPSVPVRRTLDRVGDLLDLHRLAPARYPVLLESTASGTRIGRRDLLLAASRESLELGRDGRVRDRAGRDVGNDFFAALDAAFATSRAATGSPVGGWALLIAYEAAAQVDRVLDLPSAPGKVPVARAVRIDAAIEHDRATGACVL